MRDEKLDVLLNELFSKIDAPIETQSALYHFLYRYHEERLYQSIEADTFLQRKTAIEGIDSRNISLNEVPTIVETLKQRTTIPSISDTKNTIVIPAKGDDIVLQQHLQRNIQQGRYHDLGILGEGGMGEVHSVQDTFLHRNLAMKIIHAKIMSHSDSVFRFIEEAQICAQLQHPNIVPVHDFGILPDGRYFFTMKEVQGKELGDLIEELHAEEEKKITLHQLLRIFIQCCEAVAYAHQNGVLHRDLKPSNILIGSFGEVYVVDWGIAKVLNWHQESEVVHSSRETWSKETIRGTVTGTPMYMSPEQAMGASEQIDHRTDIYALGAILYEILSGKSPYAGDSVDDILEQVRTSKPPSLHTYNVSKKVVPQYFPQFIQSLPIELISICERAMARSVEDRCSDALLLAKEVQIWLEGAQKKEQALQELEQASTYKTEWQVKEQALQQKRRDLEESFRKEGGSVQNWKRWNQCMEEEAVLRFKRDMHKEHIQKAILHDPEFILAHRKIIECLKEEYIQAVRRKNMSRVETIQKQIHHHASFLDDGDEKEALSWISILARQIKGDFRIIGRQKSIQEVAKNIEKGHRLISVCGSIGIGKSRLAQELCIVLCDTQRTIYCDLTAQKDSLDVMKKIADALEKPIQGQNVVQQVGQYLHHEPTLLILDNIDQCFSVLFSLLDSWLGLGITLKIVCTSRKKISHEQAKSLRLEPLSILSSVVFLRECIRRYRSHFEITSENRAQIFSICQHLEGIPQALEVTAARFRNLSTEEVFQKLRGTTSIYDSTQAKALGQALYFSWGLLSNAAKELLIQLSVFRGGFTVHAVEYVVMMPEEAEDIVIMPIIEELCEASFIHKTEIGGHIRYDIFSSIRDFIRQLSQVKDLELQERHARYFAQFGARENLLRVKDPQFQKEWEALTLELDNMIDVSLYGATESAIPCTFAVAEILQQKGPLLRAQQVIEKAGQRSDLSVLQYHSLRILQARFLRLMGQTHIASQLLEDVIPLHDANTQFEPYPDSFAEYWKQETHYSQTEQLLYWEGLRKMEQGNLAYNNSLLSKAQQSYEESMHCFQAIHNRRGLALILNGLGNVYGGQGKRKKAIEVYQEGGRIAQEIGFLRHAGTCLAHQGLMLMKMGEVDQALGCYKEAYTLQKQLGNRVGESINLGYMAAAIAKKNPEKAISYYEEAIQICEQFGYQKFEGLHCGNLGSILLDQEKYEQARRFLKRGIRLCTINLPGAAVSFRGALATLLYREDQPSQALALMTRDDAALQSSVLEYVVYLCRKAEILIRCRRAECNDVVTMIRAYQQSSNTVLSPSVMDKIEKIQKLYKEYVQT